MMETVKLCNGCNRYFEPYNFDGTERCITCRTIILNKSVFDCEYIIGFKFCKKENDTAYLKVPFASEMYLDHTYEKKEAYRFAKYQDAMDIATEMIQRFFPEHFIPGLDGYMFVIPAEDYEIQINETEINIKKL